MNDMTVVIVAGVAGRMGREVARAALAATDIDLAGALESRAHPVSGGTLRELGFDSDAPVGGALRDLASAIAVGDSRSGVARRPVLIEFATGQGALHHARAAAERGFAVVSGSTGLSSEEDAAFRELGGEVPVVRGANFARGALALMRISRELVEMLGPAYDVEIVETHHRGKRDAPSGTALALFEAIRGASGRDGARPVHGRHGESPRQRGEIGIHAVRAGAVSGEHRLLVAGDGESMELVHRVSGREAFADGALHAARAAAALSPGYYAALDVLMPAGTRR